jgi:hypothetical protein
VRVPARDTGQRVADTGPRRGALLVVVFVVMTVFMVVTCVRTAAVPVIVVINGRTGHRLVSLCS